MNKPALKNFAISARLELLARVQDRAAFYGITEEKYRDKAIVPTKSFQRLDGVMLSSREAQQRNDLLSRIRGKGYEQVMEEAAYTWFNRFIALRYMEEHRLLPVDVRVLPEQPGLLPQLVREAQWVELNGIDRAEITAMLEENRTEELYKTLLIALCNQLSGPLPQMFEPIADYTELLFPDGILKAESVLGMLAALNRPGEDNWGDIQVIGWLYQYYNTELKQETFDLLKKNVKITKERIGAATQLFTPEWIVNYMVENSLGRLWLEGHPDHNIQDQWRYYLEEAKQEPEVETKLAEIRRERASLQPEQITVLDPCMGSGHILVYAFDVLMTIYRAVGYTDRDAVQSIIENNLYGLDIDDRAAQLAYFALMMKACQYDRRFLRRGIQPHVCPIEPSQNIFAEDLACFGPLKQQALDLYHTFTDAKEYGSILTVPLTAEELRQLSDACDDLLQQAKTNISFEIAAMQKSCAQAIQALIPQAMILARKYDAVITNPPYMGGSGMNDKLARFVKEHYPNTKSDLSTVFMEKCLDFCNENGFMSMINIPVWMFLSSYEDLRKSILKNNTYINMVHPGRGIFGSDFGTTSFVIAKYHIPSYIGSYRRLFDKQGEVKSIEERKQAFLSDVGKYTAQQDNFSKIPGAPVAYWWPNYSIFSLPKISDYYESAGRNKTHNNELYIRNWWEISDRMRWQPYANGGSFRRWAGNDLDLVDWSNKAKDNYVSHGGLYNQKYNGKQGICWNLITSYKNGFRVKHSLHHYSSGAPTIISAANNYDYIILAFLNSCVASELLQIYNPTINTTVGDVLNLPFSTENKEAVYTISTQCCNVSQSDWDSFETSWNFQRHPLI